MSKIAVVFWSGTGNTEVMAHSIAEGIKEAGGDAVLMGPSEFSVAELSNYSAVAFGCPSMGVEVLEEAEFEPMFARLESSLSGKRIALFGSYGWGDGQWMRDWWERSESAGASLYGDKGLIVNEAPSDAEKEACKELGRGLANW